MRGHLSRLGATSEAPEPEVQVREGVPKDLHLRENFGCLAEGHRLQEDKQQSRGLQLTVGACWVASAGRPQP